MKIPIKTVYFHVIMLFPLTTLFQSYFQPLNQIMTGILLLLQLYLWWKHLDITNGFLILIAIVNEFVAAALTFGVANNTNEYFYFPILILYMTYMRKNIYMIEEYFISHRRYINMILKLWSAIVLISLFIPSCYYRGAGGAKYFGSFCHSIFRLGPTCVFIMAITMCAMVIYRDRRYFKYSLLPVLSVYMGFSRAYLLVVIIAFVIIWYFYVNNKNVFLFSLVPIGILLLYAITKSNIGDKIAYTMTNHGYFDFWGELTSGRSIFWEADMRYFFSSSWINKLIGNGLNKIYEINRLAFGGYVWAHNDFIQCLISHGLIGLWIYTLVMISTIKRAKNMKAEFFPYICMVFIWATNAAFNMFYTYLCAMLCFPFIVYATGVGRKSFEFRNKIREPLTPPRTSRRKYGIMNI